MLRMLIEVVGPDHGRAVRGQLWAIVVHSVLQGLAFALLVPAARAVLAGDLQAALWWWVALLLAAAVSCAAYYAQAMRGFAVATTATGAMYRRIGQHLSRLPIGWFTRVRLAETTRMSTAGVGEVTVVYAHLLAPLVTAVITPATVVAATLVLDWRLGLAMFVTAPLLVLTYRWSSTRIGDVDEAVEAATVVANDRILEFARNQPVLRVFGRSDATLDRDQHEAHDRLDAALTEQHATARRSLRRSAPARGVFGVTVQLSATVVLVVCGLLTLSGEVDVATVVGVLVLVIRFVEPLTALGDVGAGLRTARAQIERITAVLDTPGMPEPERPGVPAGADVELDSVRFRYPGGDSDVLTSLTARIPFGSRTALVGPSGGGKTTVTRLIGRFFDVDAGAVRIGGVDVRRLSSASLSKLVAIVFQDVYLFEGTVTDNVRFGRLDASDADVAEAMRLAKVDEIVERLPDGADTRVGEGGATLSGGERQRISLARAIVKQAPILLLDEATAALDSVNEAAIVDTVEHLAGRCTVLVVAHRLDTVKVADQILVLDGGRVTESGTHDELLSQDGAYARLWRARAESRFQTLGSSRRSTGVR